MLLTTLLNGLQALYNQDYVCQCGRFIHFSFLSSYHYCVCYMMVLQGCVLFSDWLLQVPFLIPLVGIFVRPSEYHLVFEIQLSVCYFLSVYVAAMSDQSFTMKTATVMCSAAVVYCSQPGSYSVAV